MPTESASFAYSPTPEPHRQRMKDILQAHPEIRQYMGTNPYTLWLIVVVVAVQTGLAIWIQDRSWWMQLLLAYSIGAVATSASAMMVHECAHNLVFKQRLWNYLAGILANLPMVVPSAVSFKRYHLKHHAFQGVYELDADIPSLWEAKLIGHSPLGKALWLLLLPLFHITRPFRLREITLVDRWVGLNICVVLCFDIAVYLLVGPQAFLYLLYSLFFAMGLHPLGVRWIQEHSLVHAPQETYSYYGPWNLVTLNIGYHNEHHDFPSVPWNRLPKVKQVAASWYDPLVSYTSLTKLLLRFLFDPSLSLFSRMLRQDRGGVPLTTEFTPDLELARIPTLGKRSN